MFHVVLTAENIRSEALNALKCANCHIDVKFALYAQAKYLSDHFNSNVLGQIVLAFSRKNHLTIKQTL